MDNQVKKVKIIHIHNDQKFLFSVVDYIHPKIHNESIYVTDTKLDPTTYDAITYDYNKNSAMEIIERCKSSNLVILYGLDFFKAYILNRLPTDIKVIWRFFGYELYNNITDMMLSSKTQELLKSNQSKGHSFKSVASWIGFFRHWHTRARNELTKARSKSNYIMTTSVQEYKFLKYLWPDLPTFLQFPYTRFTNQIQELNTAKRPQIIIGHSRSPYNNHLDILDILQDENIGSDVSFHLFFSYGPESNYTQYVRDLIRTKCQFNLIEDFLSKEEYVGIYRESSALIINSYRQLAGDNILTALKSGVKVYLNDKNPHYWFFIKNEFRVYDVKELIYDLKNNNFKLSEANMKHNVEKLMELSTKYSIDKFHDSILNMTN